MSEKYLLTFLTLEHFLQVSAYQVFLYVQFAILYNTAGGE